MDQSRVAALFWKGMNLFAQDAVGGALPLLYASTSPDVCGGDYIGPATLGLRGAPVRSRSTSRSYDMQVAQRLWEMSEELTGVKIEIGG